MLGATVAARQETQSEVVLMTEQELAFEHSPYTGLWLVLGYAA